MTTTIKMIAGQQFSTFEVGDPATGRAAGSYPPPLALTTFARGAAIDTVDDRLVAVLHGRTR
ncbi:hypothetical protein ACQP0C_33455 [Nocardia sp. CA-129566]|uniref:hypothetical protein n=1 Tax=Nocardia sp. CA-129566 TaxID=3239976 RepID=UPI003D951D98